MSDTTELLTELQAAIQKMVQQHVLTVRLAPRALTHEDIEMGNTQDYQNGFCDALEMVTRDYIAPLVAVYNKVATRLGDA